MVKKSIRARRRVISLPPQHQSQPLPPPLSSTSSHAAAEPRSSKPDERYSVILAAIQAVFGQELEVGPSRLERAKGWTVHIAQLALLAVEIARKDSSQGTGWNVVRVALSAWLVPLASPQAVASRPSHPKRDGRGLDGGELEAHRMLLLFSFLSTAVVTLRSTLISTAIRARTVPDSFQQGQCQELGRS